MTETPLVHIENLNVEFALGRKILGRPPMLKAVNGVSMDICLDSSMGWWVNQVPAKQL